MDMTHEIKARQMYEELEKTLQTIAPEVAIERISRYLQEFPDYPQAHNDLAVLLHRQGELLPALGRFERAVRLAPRNSTFRKNLASFYFAELGWTDDAIMMYTDLLKENPEDTEVLGALAVISYRINRPEEAGHFLQKIIELEPWNSDARNILNSLYEPIGDVSAAPTAPTTTQTTQTAQAVPTIQTAPVVAPEELDTLLSSLRQTISDLTAVNKTPEERYREAVELAGTGKTGEAITTLEDVVRSAPGYALAWNDLGVLTCQSGNVERSQTAHEEAVRLEPANTVFRKNLANLYYAALGRTDDAIRIFAGILSEQPDDVETLLALGQISAASNRPEEARIFLQKVLRLEPWNMAVRNFLSSI